MLKPEVFIASIEKYLVILYFIKISKLSFELKIQLKTISILFELQLF